MKEGVTPCTEHIEAISQYLIPSASVIYLCLSNDLRVSVPI